jgi:protein ImuB
MSSGGAVRTLVVVCAQWPTVATGRPPEVPVAVLQANRCVAVSPGAGALGVVAGLRRREAQARCPAIELFERDEQREARCFEVVLSELEQVAPRLEVLGAGACALATRGPSRYHGGDRALADLVHERVRAALTRHLGDGTLPCPVGVGVADGPRAATIAAHESIDSFGGRRPVVVPAGATAAFLAPLPVRHLAHARADATACAELIEVLGRLGLRTVGRVAELPAPDVLARFGALGMQLHRLANGAEVEPPEVGPAPVDLRVHAAVDPPAEQVDRAAFVVKALADTLHAELASRGLACTRVMVALETDAGDRIERLWRHEGALSAAAVAQRARWQLEGWLDTGRSRGRCNGGVQRVELVPDQVVPDRGVQMGFWGGTSDVGERAARAMARVQALVGPESVLVPEWRGARAPGEQYELVPLDGVDLGGRRRPGPEPWPGRVPAPAPAVVWARPRPAEVLDAQGRRVGVGGRGLISAAPVRCRLLTGERSTGAGSDGAWDEVRAWAGPWCIEERWWDATAHRRRARLQVVLGPLGDGGPGGAHPSRGVAHLLTLEGGQWWVEATYD